MLQGYTHLLSREEIPSFLFSQWWPQLSFKDGNIDLACVLLTLALSSVVGVVVPNFVRKEIRTHNGLKLFNDCLGRAQLAFVSFYLTLLVVGQFQVASQRRLMGSFLLISIIFYTVGVRLTRGQDEKVHKLHGKKCEPGGEECDLPFGAKAQLRLYWENLLLATLSSILALYLVFSPTLIRNLSGSSTQQP